MQIELLLPLELLGTGEWAEIFEVSGQSATVHRLAEMGVRAGCRLRMLRAGDPCLVQIGGSRLCLRNDSNMEITVRPLGMTEPAT